MAHFKTAYLQREVYYDATVAEELEIGDLVAVTEASGDTPASVTKVTSLASATHIVAQSDASLYPNDGVPTELGRYDYWNYNTVAASTTEWKHVALYKIIDTNDIVLDDGETA